MVTNILIILYQYKMKILNNRYIELIALANLSTLVRKLQDYYKKQQNLIHIK